MSALNIPNIRKNTDVPMIITLYANGVAVNWSEVTDIMVTLYFRDQRTFGAKCAIEADGTELRATYYADMPQYLGIADVIVNCKYSGLERTFDKPVVNFVSTSAEATGSLEIEDEGLPVDIEVTDTGMTLADAAIYGAINAAMRAAESAANGPYIGEDGYWYIYDPDTGNYIRTTTEAQGPSGPAGPEGPVGPQGPKGDTGATGLQGPKGDTGATGPQGPKGDTGATGLQGPKGDTGATGPQGPKGDTGATGPAGVTSASASVDANVGTPSVDVTLSNGNLALAFHNIKGETGAQGAQGIQGPTGPQGPEGPQGDSGIIPVASTIPVGGMLPNVFYDLGTLAGDTTFSFDTSDLDTSVANHWYWTFDTPSTAPTITWPAAITSWNGGSAPTIAASKHYEVSVIDGVGTFMEV